MIWIKLRPSRVLTQSLCSEFPFRHSVLLLTSECDSSHPALPGCPTSWSIILLRPIGNILYEQCVRLKPAQLKPRGKLPLDSGSVSAIRNTLTIFENIFSSWTHKNLSSFGFFFYSSPEKKVKSMVRYPSVLGVAKHQAHTHSFSHLNFCAGATLRDQQQGAAQTKCAGASECQLLANRGHGRCQHQSLWVILAPGCRPSPDPPGLKPKDSWRTTAIVPPVNPSYPFWGMWYVFCGFQLCEGLVCIL